MIIRKSIYLEGVKKLKVQEKKIKIKNDELLVKVESCGVCSSDIKFIFNGSRIKKYPIILGHEISGQINKNKFVVFGAEIPCKNCQTCREQKIIQIYATILFQLDRTMMVVFQIILF